MHPAANDIAPLMSAELAALLSPQIDPLFWRPTRLGVESAWYGHLPFAQWIVQATRPRVLVELGTHAGVSYSAFCEAVARGQLDTRCFAVDTWAGDEHAGFYGEEVYADLLKFHDSRYAAFSQLLRGTFDAALPYLPDASIDLLHIDGRHGYEDVAEDFASWEPKLSSRAVVLFHDTNVRERGFGVWRLWAELRERYPSFEFLHEHGLGVLAYGTATPAPVAELCRMAAAPGGVGARVRERFALLGERWLGERLVEVWRQQAAELERNFRVIEEYSRALGGGDGPASSDTMAALRTAARTATARAVASDLQLRHETARAAAAEATAASLRAALQQSVAMAESLASETHVLKSLVAGRGASDEALAAEAAMLRHHRDTLVASTSWRITAPLRATFNLVRGTPVPAPMTAYAADAPVAAWREPETAEPPAPEAAAAPLPTPRRPRALYAAGEPGTPGEQYRCVRYATAAVAAGWDAEVKRVGLVTDDDLRGVDLLILWRTSFTPEVERVIEGARRFGCRIGLDLDDLMHRPELARIEVIDGIRTIQATESATRDFFHRVAQVLERCDFCTATTPELAASMRTWQHAAYVLPNGFDAETLRAARLAARRRQAAADDGLLRIGYAGGSRTHQKDFAVIAEAVAAALRARPQTRLVLFCNPHDRVGLVLIQEFPAFDGLADQIEWRALVPLAELPNELARLDINLVPLEVGNPFVEAKSELKYPEAALAGVCSVASPTGPYRRAITDGVTGFLASAPAEWQATLLRLIDDPGLRARVARAALLDVLWRFGPERRADLMRDFLLNARVAQRGAEAAAAARAFAAGLARNSLPHALPVVNEAETLFRHDALGDAEVTVVVASFNYADYVLEALESARLQTLGPLDLVVVDDASTDPATMELVLDWAQTHAGRFNRLLVLRHRSNAGLGGTRNTGFAAAETRWVMPLDADNRLRPDCTERLLACAAGTGAAFAYPRLQQFGDQQAVFSDQPWEPQVLVGGNYIDAMTLVAKWAWAAAGGYYVQRDAMGWEDYDLWCRFAELGHHGIAVPEILADYRVHGTSMVDKLLEVGDVKEKVVAYVEKRHPWLEVVTRKAAPRAG